MVNSPLPPLLFFLCHGEPISTNLICMQPAGVVLGQLCTQCIYCDALCSVTVACVSSFRGQNNLTLKSYSTESGFNSRFLQENIIIIHLSWIPLGPLSLCFPTHYLYCNFSITSLAETWWNIQRMNFIGYWGEKKKNLERCNFRCMKSKGAYIHCSSSYEYETSRLCFLLLYYS